MDILFGILGGVGFFLLGMHLLTDGLRNFAGDSLRQALIHFTGSPWKACLSGTVATLLVQSSSATTITVIGFVSAGLLTFPRALGVEFGASLGTTGTSWIVAWIGLKIQVGYYALPLIGCGAFARLLGRRRWRHLGEAVAGFGLIFVGIGTLQQGMQGLAQTFDLAALPTGSLLAQFLAMLIGVLLTVMMQSSSAAIATILTALSAGAIHFQLATSLVIGAAIGTTVTGALAAIGAGIPARRTALAHVLFNLTTGVIALILSPLFIWGINWARRAFGWEDDAISLAAFHTAFIAMGVLMFLPFVDRFARFIERLVPDTGPDLTQHLDHTVSTTPAVALVATRRALIATLQGVLRQLTLGLAAGHWSPDTRQLSQAITRIQEYLDNLSAQPEDAVLTQSRLEQVHAVDHLTRLIPRLHPPTHVRLLLQREDLQTPRQGCLRLLNLAGNLLNENVPESYVTDKRTFENQPQQDHVSPDSATLTEPVAADPGLLQELAEQLAEIRRRERPLVIEQTAWGNRGPAEALHLLDAYRWLDRAAYHVWRATLYLTSNSNPTEHPMPDQASIQIVEDDE